MEQQGQEVDVNAVLGRLQGRIGQDAGRIAVLEAAVEARDVELTSLRARVVDLEAAVGQAGGGQA